MVRDMLQIQAAINKGAGVKTNKSNSNFNLRVPTKFLQDIDSHIEENYVGISRNSWVLAAMKEKFEKDHSYDFE